MFSRMSVTQVSESYKKRDDEDQKSLYILNSLRIVLRVLNYILI